MAVKVSMRLRGVYGINEVVLTGGVFQNSLLSKRTKEKLEAAGFVVYMQEKVPSNDGGVSLGQAIVAWERVKGD